MNPSLIGHLSVIESPANAGGDCVAVEGVVSSTSLSYLVPQEVSASWTTEDGNVKQVEHTISSTDPDNIRFVSVSDWKVRNILSRTMGAPSRKAAFNILKYRTVYRVRVRPPVFTLEKKGDRIIDDKGCEYKPYEVYVVSEKRLDLQPSSLVHLRGYVLPDPKNQKATLLCNDISFPEAIEEFDREKLGRLYDRFTGLSVKERLNWILDNFRGFSHLVGRRSLAYASFLGYFTPVWITFNGDEQRGWGLILIIGDTTTGKSETIRKVIELLQAGTMITAETASAVGLTGTATQVEGGEWFTDWGFLVLNDRRLLAIDGAQKLNHAAWATLAEAERSGVMIKATASKGSAYARTRQIKIANAVDEEAGRYSTKPLSGFLYPVQAVPTVLDVTSIARIDLAVFSDQRDVKPGDVNRMQEAGYDPDIRLLGEAMRWCWSEHAELTFTDEAVKLILREATRLYKQFRSPSIPLVEINMKWKLARLSAALAYMTLSTTPGFGVVTVTGEHVREIVGFIEETYADAGLASLARREEFMAFDPEEAVETVSQISISTKLGVDRVVDIITWLPVVGGATRDQIMEKFTLSENSELRPLLATLRNEKLVGGGRGISPSAKLIELFKLLEGPNGTKIINAAKVLHAQHFNYQTNPGQQTINDDTGSSSSRLSRLSTPELDTPPQKPPAQPVRTLADDMKVLLEALRKLENETGKAVPKDAIWKAVKYRAWMREHFDKVLDTLMKDGTVYSPRPNFYRV